VREYAHAYAALSPWDDGLESLILPEANTRCMNVFLKEVATRHPREFIVIVLDRIGWRRAKALKVPVNMALLRLPPCSPELNPVENPWGEPREKHFHPRLFNSPGRRGKPIVRCLGLLRAGPQTHPLARRLALER
jgi:hypothetical protein